MSMPAYIGRFAPSPTGPLHFGSLVAAVGSYLQARAAQGKWLLRMEDVDTPRCQAGAAEDILVTLTDFGLHWDGPVMFQGARHAAYAAALERLRIADRVYACACSRREIADASLARDGAAIYPGTCRQGLPPGREGRAWRVRAQAGTLEFMDRVQGNIHQDLATEVGDFVLRRADGFYAYQLAVVVDDAEQGITEVVRGVDLLESTPRQIYLQKILGLTTPGYLHLPIAVTAAGEKLSKQTGAKAVDRRDAGATLFWVLAFLGQRMPPDELRTAPPEDILAFAVRHWSVAAIPRQRGIPVAADG